MIKLKSYHDTKQTEKIELPDTLDLLKFPFCNAVDFDDLYKNSNSDLRHILNQVPLNNDMKYISVNMTTQILSPSVTSAPKSNWHCDGSRLYKDDTYVIHLLMSECTALTEFMEEDLIIPHFNLNSSLGDVELYINQNCELIKPRISDHSCFITFNGVYHPHRAIRAKKPEVRFMIRVMESNHIPGIPFFDSVVNKSYVHNDFIDDYTKITRDYINNNTTTTYQSVSKIEDRDGKRKIILELN